MSCHTARMKTLQYKSVVILYNPNSTGDSKKNAQALRDTIARKSDNGLRVQLIATQYAKHAEEIARTYANKNEATLLISSSGDGGYHELINGVMSAKNKSQVTVSLIPSGNANDHYHAATTSDYITNIVDGNIRAVDLIKITSTVDGQPWVRYAHSYAGFGISAYIGKHLTETDLNILNEKIVVIKGLLKFRFIRLKVDGHVEKYSSLVFANIDRMAKVLKLSDDGSVNDGRIEVNEIRYRNPFMTLLHLFRMLFSDISTRRSVSRSILSTVQPTPIQIDGEDFTLDADTLVTVEVAKQTLSFVG